MLMLLAIMWARASCCDNVFGRMGWVRWVQIWQWSCIIMVLINLSHSFIPVNGKGSITWVPNSNFDQYSAFFLALSNISIAWEHTPDEHTSFEGEKRQLVMTSIHPFCFLSKILKMNNWNCLISVISYGPTRVLPMINSAPTHNCTKGVQLQVGQTRLDLDKPSTIEVQIHPTGLRVTPGPLGYTTPSCQIMQARTGYQIGFLGKYWLKSDWTS